MVSFSSFKNSKVDYLSFYGFEKENLEDKPLMDGKMANACNFQFHEDIDAIFKIVDHSRGSRDMDSRKFRDPIYDTCTDVSSEKMVAFELLELPNIVEDLQDKLQPYALIYN